MSLSSLSDAPAIGAGTAYLRFTRSGPQTIVARSFASSPVKLFATRALGHACSVYSATLGGGFVGGDEIRMRLEVGEDARALVTTQASTKVYRSLLPASQQVEAVVEDGAFLAMLPDPIVCFAGAHFSQKQRYDLGTRANLVLLDWMTSGRHGSGERWAFRHYASLIDVRRAGQRLLYDNVVLNDADANVAERLAHFEVCLTAVVVGPQLSSEAVSIVEAASSHAIEKHPQLIVSAWPLVDNGVLVRMAGVGVEQVGAAIRSQLGFLHNWLGDDPWGRKW